jgi:hypothetical protein
MLIIVALGLSHTCKIVGGNSSLIKTYFDFEYKILIFRNYFFPDQR